MPFTPAFKYLPEPNYHHYSRLFFLARPIGWIHKSFLPLLKTRPDLFTFNKTEETLHFSPLFIEASFKERSERFHTLSKEMQQLGEIPNWRDEWYGVYYEDSPLHDPLFTIERGAAPFFGFMVFGTHINGYVTKDGETPDKIWLARRSKLKKVEPHKLDQIAAGGLSFGISIVENARREAIEEANIPEILTQNLRYAGALHNNVEEGKSIRQERLFTFDLQLPAQFSPQINDGEVEEFLLLSPLEVKEHLLTGDAFKPNSGLITLQFLLRWGLLDHLLTHREKEVLTQRLIADDPITEN